MFRFHKTLDIITLFHKPSIPASTRVLSLLKQVSAAASEIATADQASDHSAQSPPVRFKFELEVTEAPPTPDQLRTLLEYLGPSSAGKLVQGAKDEKSAMMRLRENGINFVRPVVVDWNNGKAVVGDNESQILKMLAELPKSKS